MLPLQIRWVHLVLLCPSKVSGAGDQGAQLLHLSRTCRPLDSMVIVTAVVFNGLKVALFKFWLCLHLQIVMSWEHRE